MRIIQKMQEGGLVFTPLPPTTTKSTSTSSTTNASSNSDELFSSSMIKSMSENALESDMETFLKTTKLFSNTYINPFNGSTSSFSSNAKELLLYYNKMAQQKKSFDVGVDAIKAADAWNEAAIISGGGGVYVMTSDGLDVVGVNDVTSDMKIVTNAELAKIRSKQSNYAFSSDIINSMQEATSFKQIRDVIKDVLEGIESQKYTEEGFANPYDLNKDSLKFLKSLNLTENEISGMSINAVLKVKKVTDTEKHNTMKVLNSIVSNLTPNMKTLLQLRANQLNTDVSTVILEYVSSKLKDERSVSLDVQSALTAEGELKAENKGNKLKPMTAYQIGEGGTSTRINLNPGGNTQMSSTGMSFGAPLDNEGKPIGEVSLKELLSKGFGTIGMADNGLYFGDQRISVNNFDKVLVDGLGLYRVFLPYNIDQFGAMKPNFNLYNKFSIFEKEVLKDPSKAKELLKSPEFEEFSEYIKEITPEGKIQWNNAKMAAFLMVSAEAGGTNNLFGNFTGAIDPNNDSDFIVGVKSLGIEPDAESTRLKTALKVDAGEDIFKGYVFIPLANNSSLSLLTSGELEHRGNHFVEHNSTVARQTEKQRQYVNNTSKL